MQQQQTHLVGVGPGPIAQALQQLVHHNELRDEAQRTGLCDGEDSLAVCKYTEMNYVSHGLKLAVICRNARGSVGKEFEVVYPGKFLNETSVRTFT